MLAEMANQRKKTKTNIGGWVDAEIESAIRSTGIDKTAFVELAVVRGLLKDKILSKKKLKELVEQDRLNENTVKQLKTEGFL